jgi:hypothetical protein
MILYKEENFTNEEDKFTNDLKLNISWLILKYYLSIFLDKIHSMV